MVGRGRCFILNFLLSGYIPILHAVCFQINSEKAPEVVYLIKWSGFFSKKTIMMCWQLKSNERSGNDRLDFISRNSYIESTEVV